MRLAAQALRLGPLTAHQQHRGGAVADLEELPAVWMPSGATGLRPASASALVSRRPWSRVTTTVSPVGSVLAERGRSRGPT